VAVTLVVVVVSPPPALGSTTRPPQRWATPTHGEPKGFAHDADAVAVAGYDRLQVLDATTGRTRWEARVTDLAYARPGLGADVVMVAGRDGVHAFERATGEPRFVVALPGVVRVVLATGGDGRVRGVAAAPDSGVLTAFDLRTGAVHWSVSGRGALAAGPVVDPTGVAAVIAGLWYDDRGFRLRVLDAATGALRFEERVYRQPAAPAVASDGVFMAEGDQNFVARVRRFDLVSGATRWETAVPASFEVAIEPRVDGGDLAVVDHFGRVTLLDRATGAIRWQRATRQPTLRTPVVLGADTVAFTTFSTRIVVLDRATGRLRSRFRLGGSPIDLAAVGSRLLVALRVARPSRVELLPVP
jgi:outer membrane protein assembly factor BamB